MESVLGSDIDSSAALMEAGLDSLGAVELRNTLSQQFEVQLPATFTFDYPTVSAMAGYINSLLGEFQDATGADGHTVVERVGSDQRLVQASRVENGAYVQAITGLSVRWALICCMWPFLCISALVVLRAVIKI